jgi:Fic family protein
VKATVHRIGHNETLLQFVAREGVTNSENVARRFGWGQADARNRLRDLVKSGHLVESGPHPMGDGCGGARLEWRIA